MLDNSDFRSYFKRVRLHLECSAKQKKRIMEIICNSIQDYCNNTSNEVTIDEIYREFGTPKEIAEFYLGEIDPSELRKYRTNKLFKISAILFLISIIVTSFFVFLFKESTFTITHSGPIDHEEATTFSSSVSYRS